MKKENTKKNVRAIVNSNKIPYFTLPKSLIHRYDVSVALVYSYLENQSYQFEVRGTLPKDRFFYKRQENIAARCNMSKSKIIRCLNVLEKDGYIETKFSREGGKNTKHYRVDLDFLENKDYDFDKEARDNEAKLVKIRNKYIRESRNKAEQEVKIEKEIEPLIPENYVLTTEQEFAVEYQEYLFNNKNETK